MELLLQDSFVLCRVVKKNGLVTKSGDQSVAPTEKNDSDGANNSTLPGNLAQTFYSEHQSPVLQEGENNTNLKLPSETSSENFNDMTEDNIERWLDVLLDDPDQNCSIASPVELTNNAKLCGLLLFVTIILQSSQFLVDVTTNFHIICN